MTEEEIIDTVNSSFSHFLFPTSGDDNNWMSRLEEDFKRSDDNRNDENDTKGGEAQKFSRRLFQTPITTYTGTLELLNGIDNAQSNDLTIVLFFSYYFRACYRENIPFKKLAYELSSTSDVHFVRFETSVLTPKQFQSRGLDRVPYIQIYRNKICVASFSVTSGTSRNL